ncbi:MAG: mechanosensitive ion channel family protein [Sphingomonas sp.]
MQGLTDLLNTAQNTAQNTASNSSTAAHVEGAHVAGVTLIGATPDNFRKLLLTLGFILAAWLITRLLRFILGLFIGSRSGTRFQFWAKQGVSLIVAAILVLGVMSIWFDNPARLAGALALIGAGIAFALQRVITAVAGYFVILRGKTFNVGDRIVMGGVRGDVIDLSFMQTRIMEMGQSPKEQGDAPSMWVRSRQFTGRIVTVTNDKVFDEPVYNYTREFPYIWDEINIPTKYGDDAGKVEELLLAAARRHALTHEKIGDEEVQRLKDEFGINVGEIDPRVYWRLTDNWVELTLRFLAPDHGIRNIKDAMSREILDGLNRAKIEVASGTYEIVGVPPLKVELAQPR